jgi:hypothetical protein
VVKKKFLDVMKIAPQTARINLIEINNSVLRILKYENTKRGSYHSNLFLS